VSKLRIAPASAPPETRKALPGHPWNVIDMEISAEQPPEATRQLCRLVVLALIGEKHYTKEVGTGGDDLDLIYDLAWAAEHYATVAAEGKAVAS
jgi:hypothetical protein